MSKNDPHAMTPHTTDNPATIEEMVRSNEGFILQCVSKVTHRFATRSDDEWSVALEAFCHAVETYDPDRGNFHSFAELVIKRRVIDYMRHNARYAPELLVAPESFDEPASDDEERPPMQGAILARVARSDDNSLRVEIEILGGILSGYGFTFMDLAACSPRATKTKAATATAIATLVRTPLLMNELRSTHSLPIGALVQATALPRKILERHRKYIIAAAEILSGEFEGLAEYLAYIREELKG